MDPAYRLEMTPPSVADYVRLRRDSGLSPKTEAQAAAAVTGSWCFCHAVGPGAESVGMGRVIGDGGWYFHIADMAVAPEHQRKGIGDAILSALLSAIADVALPDPYVTLMADAPGRRLYERHGFVPTAPHSIGMKLA